MNFINLIEEAQLHREVYAAIMRSALPHGEVIKLAKKVGKSREYIECILNTSREPSGLIAEKIASVLPLEQEQRKSLIEHMMLSKESNLRSFQVMRKEFSPEWLDEQLEVVKNRFIDAAHAGKVDLVEGKYTFVRDTIHTLLTGMTLKNTPVLTFVDTCMLLHNVQCVLDRPDEALFYAKLASSILDSQDIPSNSRDKEGYHFYRVEAARAEALAYHNLELDDYAYRINQERTLSVLQDAEDAGIYFPVCELNIYVNLTRAYSKTLRPALYKIEQFTDQALKACDNFARKDALTANYWEFVIRRSLGSAYLDHNNLKKAQRIFVPLIERLNTQTNISMYHQVSSLYLYADICLRMGKKDEFSFYIKEAIEKAKSGVNPPD